MISSFQASLSAKDRKLKVLLAELSAREAGERCNAQQLAELRGTLAQTKTQLLEEKRRKQKLLDERQLLEQMQAHCYSAPAQLPRTLGAGFKVISQLL